MADETTTETTDATPPAGDQATATPPQGGDGAQAGTVLSQPPESTPPQKAEAEGEGGDKTTTEDGKGENTDPGSDVEFDLTPPEGMEGYAKEFEAFATDVKGWMKEHPEASAADALKWAAGRQAEIAKQQGIELIQKHNDRTGAWLERAKADPAIGGDKFDENVATAIKGLEVLKDPELAEQLEASGLGNHPFILRALAAVGKQGEQSPVLAPAGGGARPNFANTLYPD
jgi:hypothetical protein